MRGRYFSTISVPRVFCSTIFFATFTTCVWHHRGLMSKGLQNNTWRTEGNLIRRHPIRLFWTLWKMLRSIGSAMLNYIWLGLILLSVIIGGCMGNLKTGAHKSPQKAEVAVMKTAPPLVAIIAFWRGIIRLVSQSGLLP